MKIVELKIKGWEKYNPRSDVKSCSWFRMSNDFFSDPEFYGISVDARVVWIFILSTASRKMTSQVKIRLEMVSDVVKISPDRALEALGELLQTGALELVSGNVKSARSNPIVSPMLLSATNERTDERTDTPAASFDPVGWLDSEKVLHGTESEEGSGGSVVAGFFGPEDKQEIEEIPASENAVKVLTALNTICFRSFRPVKSNLQFINARLKEGYTYENFVSVITHRNELWKNDRKMSEFLRPKTLFNSENFDGYLQAAENANKPKLDPLDEFFAPYMEKFKEVSP